MLDRYANQSLTWKHFTAIDAYNEATYSSTTIKGRKETGFKLIRNSQGQETVSSAQVFTESAIEVNDLIDDKLVMAVDTQIKLDGGVGFREVYLK